MKGDKIKKLDVAPAWAIWEGNWLRSGRPAGLILRIKRPPGCVNILTFGAPSPQALGIFLIFQARRQADAKGLLIIFFRLPTTSLGCSPRFDA